MKKQLTFFLTIMLLTQFGCDSPGAFDCVKRSGSIVEEEVIVGEFERIYIYDGLELNLTHGDDQKVMIRGGENLIPEVNFELAEKDLIISNKNSCNWVRDYEAITITVTTNQLKEIESGGFGLVKSTNILNFEELVVESKDGSGDFDLTVAINKLVVANNSISNIRISGVANSLSVGHWYNDGRFDGTALEVNDVRISQNGVNDIYINVKEKLSGELTSRGNIVYFGDPETVEVSVSGTGKLINKQ